MNAGLSGGFIMSLLISSSDRRVTTASSHQQGFFALKGK